MAKTVCEGIFPGIRSGGNEGHYLAVSGPSAFYLISTDYSDLRDWLFHSHMGSGSGVTNSLGLGSGMGANNLWG
jgi:hypothetical protein